MIQTQKWRGHRFNDQLRSIIMYARRLTLPDRSYAHVFFRCHNRQHLFKPPEVKDFLLMLWAKYKKKYRVEIHEFIIMDNHAHLLLKATSTKLLGDFMRDVNSQLARFINTWFERDSQAIRERYKSPLVEGLRYLHNVMSYIWFNRNKVDGSTPQTDPYCSLYWRLNPDAAKRFSDDPEVRSIMAALINSDPDIYPSDPTEQRRRALDLFNEFNSIPNQNKQWSWSKCEHGHTISCDSVITFRTDFLSAFRRDRVPWRYDTDPPTTL